MSVTVRLRVEGMTCQGCVKRVMRHLSREDGVLDVKVSLDSREAELTIDPRRTSATKILKSRVFTKPFRVRAWDGGWWTDRYSAKLVSTRGSK